jgi:hypothetical protein
VSNGLIRSATRIARIFHGSFGARVDGGELGALAVAVGHAIVAADLIACRSVLAPTRFVVAGDTLLGRHVEHDRCILASAASAQEERTHGYERPKHETKRTKQDRLEHSFSFLS